MFMLSGTGIATGAAHCQESEREREREREKDNFAGRLIVPVNLKHGDGVMNVDYL
jgi:hypothetical protein